MYTNIKTGPALHRIGQFTLEKKGTPDCTSCDADGSIKTSNEQQCVPIWGHILASKSGNSDGSATSAPLGHNLLWDPRGDSAHKIWTEAPALLSLPRRSILARSSLALTQRNNVHCRQSSTGSGLTSQMPRTSSMKRQ